MAFAKAAWLSLAYPLGAECDGPSHPAGAEQNCEKKALLMKRSILFQCDGRSHPSPLSSELLHVTRAAPLCVSIAATLSPTIA